MSNAKQVGKTGNHIKDLPTSSDIINPNAPWSHLQFENLIEQMSKGKETNTASSVVQLVRD